MSLGYPKTARERQAALAQRRYFDGRSILQVGSTVVSVSLDERTITGLKPILVPSTLSLASLLTCEMTSGSWTWWSAARIDSSPIGQSTFVVSSALASLATSNLS